MFQKKTILGSAIFVAALLVGVFQNCSGGGADIAASDQKSTAVLSPAPGTQNAISCGAMQSSNCILPTMSDTALGGTCAPGSSGSCSYRCTNGTWSQIFNNCTPAPCAATTINGCQLGAAASGTGGGSCGTSSNGSCAATCSNGTWSVTANTCSPKVLKCTFTQQYKYYFVNDGAGVAPTNAQFSTADQCASYCASTGAALCQYFWVNYVYYCSAFSAAVLAQSSVSDFASPSAVGPCSLQ